MRIFLLFGFAFEALADAFEDRLIVRIEGVAERALPLAVTLGDKLHHRDRGDDRCGGELLHRSSWRRASMSKPLVLVARKSCSIVQRRR